MRVAIQTTNGRIVQIDESDLALVVAYKWVAHAPDKALPDNFYAVTTSVDRATGRRRTIWMHRLIVGCPNGMQVDHRDHDGLNNVRSNLRICTGSQNNANARMRPGRSGYRGVYRKPSNGRFLALIWVNYKRIKLGTFASAESAARARDEAALKHFGEFAQLNFPVKA